MGETNLGSPSCLPVGHRPPESREGARGQAVGEGQGIPAFPLPSLSSLSPTENPVVRTHTVTERMGRTQKVLVREAQARWVHAAGDS